ncbi:phage tail family protein [Williamsia muralis]|uniref:hypothetical protein n=1 Tax=Williamsia marianensis TaxID=85044 RepID=UPI003F139521
MSETDMQLYWHAPDGTRWDWLDGSMGVNLGEGLEGVVFPDFEQLSSVTPYGRRYNGTRWKPATVQATLQVCDIAVNQEARAAGGYYRRGPLWRALDRRVRQSLSATEPGKFECVVDGQSRFLSCRLEDIGCKWTKVPDLRGIVSYDITLVDDEPFWKGETVSYDFPYQESSSQDYYGGAGPPLYISTGNASGLGEVDNSSDVAVWPTWEITGPVQATVGFGEAVTAVTFIGSGETLTMVTDPNRRDVFDENGNRAWDKLEARRFEPIPAGKAPLVVETSSGGVGSNVRVSYQPAYLGLY